MAISWIAMSFSIPAPGKGRLEIDVLNTVGAQPLQLDEKSYTNALGQTYTVSNFKYYISNITLKNRDGKEFKSDAAFLVTEDDDASRKIQLPDVPEGDYSFSFTLGIDSVHNCSGAQTGALDPVNGMFWAWNSGYIFLKLEGKSPASASPGHIFEYHIGGYRFPNNCIRRITFEQATVSIRTGVCTRLQLKADAAEVLQSPKTIDFTALSSVTDFHNATSLADNCTDMFSISLIR